MYNESEIKKSRTNEVHEMFHALLWVNRNAVALPNVIQRILTHLHQFENVQQRHAVQA